jgi:hypothetical protein
MFLCLSWLRVRSKVQRALQQNGSNECVDRFISFPSKSFPILFSISFEMQTPSIQPRVSKSCWDFNLIFQVILLWLVFQVAKIPSRCGRNRAVDWIDKRKSCQ